MHETSNNQMPGHQPSVDKVKTAYAIAPMTVGALVLGGGAMGFGLPLFTGRETLLVPVAINAAVVGAIGGATAVATYNVGVTPVLGESSSGPNMGTFMLGATAAGGSALAASAASTALMLLM